MRTPYVIVTNNPLVVKNLENSREIIYKDVSYEEILRETRDRIHEGHGAFDTSIVGQCQTQ